MDLASFLPSHHFSSTSPSHKLKLSRSSAATVVGSPSDATTAPPKTRRFGQAKAVPAASTAKAKMEPRRRPDAKGDIAEVYEKL